MYPKLAPKLTAIATASVARSVGALVDPELPAGGLEVAFFATGPGRALKIYTFPTESGRRQTKLEVLSFY